uniref:WD_REPEATS_REGION domain-containing protein n=1 Tax=Echinostoma caproni TaxID=27848 RepID=A0A183B1H4_9TREM
LKLQRLFIWIPMVSLFNRCVKITGDLLISNQMPLENFNDVLFTYCKTTRLIVSVTGCETIGLFFLFLRICFIQVLSVTFNDTAEMIFSGGIDNVVKGWDIRKLDVSILLSGHTDTVTGLSVSPDGSFLLSNAMDNTLRLWDIRPFAPPERCMKVSGEYHTFEKNMLRCAWSADGRRVTCGSGDRYVHVWDVPSRQLVYKLPGHTASVNETAFHPREPILLSVGSDKKIFLGEILPCY